jgi:hypothetical protein
MKTRTIRLIRPPRSDEPGVLCIMDKRKTTFYVFCEFPCEIGGRAFALHRLGLGTLYHVRVGALEECSCECLGFLSKGRCKHIQGLLALTGHGMI